MPVVQFVAVSVLLRLIGHGLETGVDSRVPLCSMFCELSSGGRVLYAGELRLGRFEHKERKHVYLFQASLMIEEPFSPELITSGIFFPK